MHPNRAPCLPSRKVVHPAAPLAAADHMLMLQRELVHALERAGHLERRAHAAERELARLRAQTAVRAQGSHVCRADLEHELRRVRRELVRSKVDGRERLRAMRIELLATKARCWALDEVCRALLLTIEHAASSVAAELPPAAGVAP